MHKFTKKALAVSTAAALLLGGGAAYAYWTTTGSGTGSAANAASAEVLVLHANFEAGLAPGKSVAVTYTADNPGGSNLFVTTLTNPVVTTSDASCLARDFTATATSPGTNVLPHTTATTVGSGMLAFANTLDNQEACKNAVITISLTSS